MRGGRGGGLFLSPSRVMRDDLLPPPHSLRFRFDHILIPIAATVIAQSQRADLSFDAFYTHTLCHECCHGIGPHTITLPGGTTSTVRQVGGRREKRTINPEPRCLKLPLPSFVIWVDVHGTPHNN